VLSAAARSAVSSKALPHVQRAAGHRLAVGMADRQRFACQGRFVQGNGTARRHQPVHRQHRAGFHQQPVTGLDLRHRHGLPCPRRLPFHRGGGARQQRGQFAAGAVGGVAFQRLTAGEHQRDDGGGEHLPQQQRTGHGQSRHQIDAPLTPAQLAQAFQQQPQQHRRGGHQPQPVGRLPGSAQGRDAAGGGEQQDQGEQQFVHSNSGGGEIRLVMVV
jgi:hypothetical protein